MIRHAVGIDERRAKFRQDLIDKVDMAEVVRQRSWKATRKKHKNKNKKTKANKPKSRSSFLSRTLNSDGDDKKAGGPGRYGHENTSGPYGESHLERSHAAVESLVSLIVDYDSQSEEDDNSGQDIEEVWFPGCHGDIGGGWDLPPDEEPLSHGPLVWMVCVRPNTCGFRASRNNTHPSTGARGAKGRCQLRQGTDEGPKLLDRGIRRDGRGRFIHR